MLQISPKEVSRKTLLKAGQLFFLHSGFNQCISQTDLGLCINSNPWRNRQQSCRLQFASTHSILVLGKP